MQKIIGIIPARYQSQRLPGKPLALLQGKPMIQWVYEQARKAASLQQVIVATDDERIFRTVEGFGGLAMLTDPQHPSGTDRCAEVIERWREDYTIAINIQGDLPFIAPQQINELAALFKNPNTQIATLAKKIEKPEELSDETEAKVAMDEHFNVVYMSRSPIPHLRGYPMEEWISRQTYYKHIGIYGFQRSVLQQIPTLPPSPLEKSEKLEQLRWLSHFKIRVGITEYENLSVDTPEDLEKAEAYLREQTIN